MNDTRWLTLLRLKRRMGIENATLTEGDSARLEAALRAAQGEIEAATGRQFAPVYATVSHTAREGQESLLLRDDLLELVSVVDARGETISAAETTYDHSQITLNDAAGFVGGEVSVTGWWAYHPAPLLAFRPSGDSVTGDVNDSGGSIAVNGAAGADTWGDTPRFMPDQLIRIDDELMRIMTVAGNTLTVRRGENGTDAAAHVSGTPIMVYVAGFAVESLGLRLAAWLYREADGEHGREWPQGIETGIQRLQRVRV